MPYLNDPTYIPNPRGGAPRFPFAQAPFTPRMTPVDIGGGGQVPFGTGVPFATGNPGNPGNFTAPIIPPDPNDPNDPRNDPRNIRARRARENPLLTPPPPPPPTMSYGPATGAPTASLSPGGGGMPNPAPWGKSPMLPGHGVMYPKPLVSIPQWGGGGPSVGFRTPTGLSPQRPKLF